MCTGLGLQNNGADTINDKLNITSETNTYSTHEHVRVDTYIDVSERTI